MFNNSTSQDRITGSDFVIQNTAVSRQSLPLSYSFLDAGGAPPAPPPRGEGARAESAALTKAHISPLTFSGSFLGECKPYFSGKITFWRGGSLFKVSKGIHSDLKGGGIRSVVTTFSKQSRRRLIYRVNMVKRDKLPLFGGLTYPDHFPFSPERWSRDLDTLRKRIARAGWAAIWKKEIKPRLSGDNKGKFAPHFHFFLWGANLLQAQVIRRWWYEIVNSGDPEHLLHGGKIEAIHSPNGVKSYASKYLTKLDDMKVDPGKGLGRFWGVINAEKIPWAEPVTVSNVSFSNICSLMRLMRRFMRKARAGNLPGLTLICNSDFWMGKISGDPPGKLPILGESHPGRFQTMYRLKHSV